jgi:hypothetical protein
VHRRPGELEGEASTPPQLSEVRDERRKARSMRLVDVALAEVLVLGGARSDWAHGFLLNEAGWLRIPAGWW